MILLSPSGKILCDVKYAVQNLLAINRIFWLHNPYQEAHYCWKICVHNLGHTLVASWRTAAWMLSRDCTCIPVQQFLPSLSCLKLRPPKIFIFLKPYLFERTECSELLKKMQTLPLKESTGRLVILLGQWLHLMILVVFSNLSDSLMVRPWSCSWKACGRCVHFPENEVLVAIDIVHNSS